MLKELRAQACICTHTQLFGHLRQLNKIAVKPSPICSGRAKDERTPADRWGQTGLASGEQRKSRARKKPVWISYKSLVSGVCSYCYCQWDNSGQDEQVIDFERIVFVNDSLSELYQNLIVEYSSGSALEALEPHLPYTCIAQGDPTVVYEVKTLSSVCATKVGSTLTKTYLAGLKQLAKMSGKEYGEVLKGMITQIGKYVETMQSKIPLPHMLRPLSYLHPLLKSYSFTLLFRMPHQAIMVPLTLPPSLMVEWSSIFCRFTSSTFQSRK